MLLLVFPWIDKELSELESRTRRNRFCQDIALRQFLLVMKWFRLVLLQDLAVIYTMNPHCYIFGYAPFNSPSFREYAIRSSLIISTANEEAERAVKQLPEAMASSMRGVINGVTQGQQLMQERDEKRWKSMQSDVADLKALVEGIALPKKSRGAKRSFGKHSSHKITSTTNFLPC